MILPFAKPMKSKRFSKSIWWQVIESVEVGVGKEAVLTRIIVDGLAAFIMVWPRRWLSTAHRRSRTATKMTTTTPASNLNEVQPTGEAVGK